MKKISTLIVVMLTICLVLAGCPQYTDQPPQSDLGDDSQTGTPSEHPNDGNGQTSKEEITKMYITINGNTLEVTLENNSSVDALVERLKQSDVIYTASDYGGFEKVGGLGFSLPTNNSQITTQAGDVILYSGNQIVLFYGSNSWSYTRLGKINGHSVSELKSLLGAGKGDVTVKLSITR